MAKVVQVSNSIVWQRTKSFVQRRHQFPPLTLLQLSPVAWPLQTAIDKIRDAYIVSAEWLINHKRLRPTFCVEREHVARALKAVAGRTATRRWNCSGSCALGRRRHRRPEVDSELRTTLLDATRRLETRKRAIWRWTVLLSRGKQQFLVPRLPLLRQWRH